MVEAIEAAEQITIQWPLVILGSALLIGLFLEFGVLRLIGWLVRKTPWRFDGVLVRALRWMPLFWSLLIGARFAAELVSLGGDAPVILNNSIIVLMIISGSIVALRILTGYVQNYAEQNSLPSISLFKILLQIVIGMVGFLLVMVYFDIPVSPIAAALAASGLGLSLALQEPLSNLFSGIVLVISNKIQPGHYIRLSTGEEGYVYDINWYTTQLLQLGDNMIIVPNSQIASEQVINFNYPSKEMSLIFRLGVSYDSDLERVERVTKEVANEVMQEMSGGVSDYDCLIRFNQFADFSINFSVIMRIREMVDQFAVTHEFIKQLHRRYHEEGITIPFPITTLHTLDSRGLELMPHNSLNGASKSAHDPANHAEASSAPAKTTE